jgi:adenosine deaminase
MGLRRLERCTHFTAGATRVPPGRIGHGVLAAGREDLCSMLRDQNVVLELRSTSNLRITVHTS